MATIKLYCFTRESVASKSMAEYVQTRENGNLLSDVPTGVIYPDWDAAARATSEKNMREMMAAKTSPIW